MDESKVTSIKCNSRAMYSHQSEQGEVVYFACTCSTSLFNPQKPLWWRTSIWSSHVDHLHDLGNAHAVRPSPIAVIVGPITFTHASNLPQDDPWVRLHSRRWPRPYIDRRDCIQGQAAKIIFRRLFFLPTVIHTMKSWQPLAGPTIASRIEEMLSGSSWTPNGHR